MKDVFSTMQEFPNENLSIVLPYWLSSKGAVKKGIATVSLVSMLVSDCFIRQVRNILRLTFASAGEFLLDILQVRTITVEFFDTIKSILEIASAHEFDFSWNFMMNARLKPFS